MKNNNPFTAGIADMWYSGTCNDLWVEYKWLPKKPKVFFTPALSKLQLKWLKERYTEGRNVAVIVGCPDGAVILRDLIWEKQCSFVNCLTRQEIAQWITKETI